MRRPDQRRTGYTAAKPNKAPEERASSSAAGPPPSSTDAVSVPEVVRQRKLKEFRRTLYENALDKKGRLKPSAAADFPVTAEQENCTHPWEGIRWGANGSAHWGHCKQCHLKRVLYYSNEHGAMVAGRVAQQVFMLDGGAVSVILDTGCRTAVAGSRWHRQFQKALEDQQLSWSTVDQEEIFRFGAGAPILSTRAMIYPVTLGESKVKSWLRISEVNSTSTDDRVEWCPALVGPSEMARWNISFDFAGKRVRVGDKDMAMEMSPTRHPIMKMVVGKSSQQEWETPELDELKRVLTQDPFSLALMQEHLDNEDDGEPEEEAVETWASGLEAGDDGVEEAALAEWQEELETQAIAELDAVLAKLPANALITREETEETSDSEGSISEGVSESSHDEGWSGESDSSTETDSSNGVG